MSHTSAILELARDGLTSQQIAVQLGMSDSGVRNALCRARQAREIEASGRVRTVGHAWSDEDNAKLLALRAAGVTVAACATALGRTTGATGKQLGKLGATSVEKCGDEQIKTIWQLSPLHQRTLRRLKPEWFL